MEKLEQFINRISKKTATLPQKIRDKMDKRIETWMTLYIVCFIVGLMSCAAFSVLDMPVFVIGVWSFVGLLVISKWEPHPFIGMTLILPLFLPLSIIAATVTLYYVQLADRKYKPNEFFYDKTFEDY